MSDHIKIDQVKTKLTHQTHPNNHFERLTRAVDVRNVLQQTLHIVTADGRDRGAVGRARTHHHAVIGDHHKGERGRRVLILGRGRGRGRGRRRVRVGFVRLVINHEEWRAEHDVLGSAQQARGRNFASQLWADNGAAKNQRRTNNQSRKK